MDGTIVGAIITAVGGVITVIIAHRLSSRTADDPSPTGGHVVAPAAARTGTLPSPSAMESGESGADPGALTQSPSRADSDRGKIVLKVNETYVDPETNFIVVATLILRLTGTGAHMRWTLPDGKTTEYDRKVELGTRIDFAFKDRRFFMLLEKVDGLNDTVTIRIIEVK